MIFTDMTANRVKSHSTVAFRRLSLNDELHQTRQKLNFNKQNQKLKRLHTSVLDLLNWNQAKNTIEIENNNINEQQSLPYRRSIIKSSDISKVLSKKSVTFASSFDSTDSELDKEEVISNPETNINDEIVSKDDLVIVVPNKQFNDETTEDSDENIEPYPFRSEIPVSLSPQSNSPVSDTNTSHRSRKKIINNFIHHRSPKKLRHPVHITDSASTVSRSSSTPDITIPTSLSSPAKKDDQQTPLKTMRVWFKSSSFGRFIHSFSKNSHQNRKNNNTSNKNTRSSCDSTEFKQISEPVY